MDKIVALLERMEKLAYDDAMFVPLWGDLFINVYSPYVKDNIWYWASDSHPHLERTWLDRKR